MRFLWLKLMSALKKSNKVATSTEIFRLYIGLHYKIGFWRSFSSDLCFVPFATAAAAVFLADLDDDVGKFEINSIVLTMHNRYLKWCVCVLILKTNNHCRKK